MKTAGRAHVSTETPRVTPLREMWRAAGAIAATLLSGGIPSDVAAQILSNAELVQFRRDVEYVRELCAKFGGDKIFATADNVEGVLQMRARNPASLSGLQDREGMFDPWGYAQGDREVPDVPIGYAAGRYRFLEMQPAYGTPSGPPFRRKVLVPVAGTPAFSPKDSDSPGVLRWEEKVFVVGKLRSKYGYITEDLTTPEMRSRWVAGGKIKLIELATNKVMAERVGYFRAIGSAARDHWSGAGAYQNERICPNTSSLPKFLLTVLRPLAEVQPTPQSARSYTGD